MGELPHVTVQLPVYKVSHWVDGTDFAEWRG
jgi:hypothetical protein